MTIYSIFFPSQHINCTLNFFNSKKMNNSAVFVIGPAGTGKTTFCKVMNDYYTSLKRKVCLFNLDPAAINGAYHASITQKWDLNQVMDQYKLGPNGAMVKCLELCTDDPHWLEDQFSGISDETLFIDCPGQIELYTHEAEYMKKMSNILEKCGYKICIIYLVDSTYKNDEIKFNSALLNSLSANFQFQLPHLTVMTKMDIEPLESTINEGSNNNLLTRIKDLLYNYMHNEIIPFNYTETEDLYIISAYIDRMLGQEN